MNLTLARLLKMPLPLRFSLVAGLAPVQVFIVLLLPNLGLIWIPATLAMVLANLLLPRGRAAAASLLSAAALLISWHLHRELPGPSPQQSLVVEVGQIALFLTIVTWTIQTVAERLRFLDAVSRVTGEFVYLLDPRGTITYVNEVAAERLGYFQTDLIDRCFTAATPPWFHEEAWRMLEAVHKHGRSVEIDVAVVTRSGEELTVRTRVQPFLMHGRVHALGVGQNVTEAQRAERLFSAAFDAATEPAVVRDRDGRILACNAAYANSLGKTKAELLGTPLPPYGFTPDQLPGWEAATTSAEPSIRDVLVPGGRVFRLIFSPIFGERGQVLASLTFVPDVTAEKEAESRMIQAAQLAAIGQVSAGAAHNINNILAAISVSAELLNLDPVALGPYVSRDILAAVDRGSGIVKRLYRLAGRGDKPKLEPVIAADAFCEVLQLVAPQCVSKGITVVKEIPPALQVLADSSMLHQVLMNLIINALQAMPAEGTLTLRAREYGAAVDLEVSDTGDGIPPEHVERLFTPFFTTKANHQGTGLGLSTSLQMVRTMHGDILVQSAVGVGSTFTVRLPAAVHPPGEG
ncbi:MAG: putative Histidine kinase [Symbiobacteriaceae bacterium]|jgi:PAS domain S-box-containing protein|nr:putative Histidine kinase [Symbiobacteriaceae bacterium]